MGMQSLIQSVRAKIDQLRAMKRNAFRLTLVVIALLVVLIVIFGWSHLTMMQAIREAQ